jgi:dTDP-4-dehydrorhamnose reductase
LRILILGGAGMLGHKLWQLYAPRTDTHTDTYTEEHTNTRAENRAETYVTLRSPLPIKLFDPQRTIYGVSAQDMDSVARALAQVQPDVVINCIGVVKQQQAAKDPITSIQINSLFPHRLALLCKASGTRLVHFSTDCVFSGRKGGYVETDVSDAEDLYGRSKYLGEVDEPGCLTLRTSIIGFELDRQQGLLEWYLSQRNKPVKGYRRAIFSGFTTSALAEIVWNVITRHPHLSGVWHVASEPIDKYTLLTMIKDRFAINGQIIHDDVVQIDRSLNAEKFNTATGFVPPSWDHMIRQLADEADAYMQIKRHMHEGYVR